MAGCVESRAELHRAESRVYQLSCIGHRAEEEKEEEEEEEESLGGGGEGGGGRRKAPMEEMTQRIAAR